MVQQFGTALPQLFSKFLAHDGLEGETPEQAAPGAC